MSDIAAMLGVNATVEAVDTKNPALAVHNHILVRVVGTCLVIYIAWQYLLRIGALWNSHSEPPMLPYWIPGKSSSPFSQISNTNLQALATIFHFSEMSRNYWLLQGQYSWGCLYH